MKKKLLLLTTIFVLAAAMLCLTACPPTDSAVDPTKTDGSVYDVAKLHSTLDLPLSSYVKELKQEDGGWIVKTEANIASDTKMTLEVTFKDGKFEDVGYAIIGTQHAKFAAALEVELDTTPAPTTEIPDPEPSSVTKSNDPTAVKGLNIRLPRAERTGANNKRENPFDFDTAPATGATDHQLVGSAAYKCLEYSVAAYRFVLAAKNVFGSYANYLEATEKAVNTAWAFGGTLASVAANNPAVKIERLLEFPLSYIVFATSSASPHAQTITAMVRIDKATHKVLKADYAFFHVSEYRSDADKFIESLDNAKAAVVGANVTTVYSAKSGDPAVYDLNGVTNATLTNSVLVNAYNAAFKYYDDNLKGSISHFTLNSKLTK